MHKRTVRKLFCAAMSAVMILLAAMPQLFASAQSYGGFTQEDMLVTRGRDIVNQRGEEVVLKGVNLGGWLIQEEWMCPIEQTIDNISTMETLESRFGVDNAYSLMNTYQDNWITETDLDYIKEMGFNCVRVPFWFRNFYYNDTGSKIYDENGNWNFERLDWVIEECAERKLYVILDLHGAPGYQSNAQHTGKENDCGLFRLGSKAEKWRKLTIELWTAIAERYNGNPTVAMYDLLNEPMCDVKAYLVKSDFAVWSLYDRLYDAIRAVDSEHIITMEGIWRIYNLPSPSAMDWSNVVYQLHLYNKSNIEFLAVALSSYVLAPNVPLYIGEFRPLGSASWDMILETFNDFGFSWTLWTYKGAMHDAVNSEWLLYGSNHGFERGRVQTDTFDELARKWGECMRTEINYTQTPLYEKVKPFI